MVLEFKGGEKIFQTQPEPTQQFIPQLSPAEWLGVFAFVISVSFTLFELYQRYYRGSDIKLIVNRHYDFVSSIGDNNEDRSLTFSIPMIFTNNGNRTGVVTYLKVDQKESPKFTASGAFLWNKAPLQIKAKDCVNAGLRIKWELEEEIFHRLQQSGGFLRSKIEITWKRTHSTGKFFKKIEIENKFRKEEIEIFCRVE